MRIGIDIRAMRDVRTGIGRYILNLTTALAQSDGANEYIMFYNGFGLKVPHGLPEKPNFHLSTFHWPRKVLTAIWAYAGFPSVEGFIGDIDVFHSPGHQVPPSRKAASVFTIYDLISLTHPEMAIPSSVRHVGPRIRHYAGRADLIVAISRATAYDIERLLCMPAEKVVTVYPGATPFLRSSPEDISSMKRRFGLGKDYVLFVSRLDPRKNLPRLIRAFEQSGLYADFELVVVGPEGWHMKETFETWHAASCRDQIRWLNYVTDNDLSSLYSGATFLAYPSLLEGFGLPILEAMSVGCPVLTSNVSSMPEVAGDVALYVDPADTESIANGLRRLAEDSALRMRLSQMGPARAAMFSWEKTAMGMIKVYEQAISIRRS